MGTTTRHGHGGLHRLLAVAALTLLLAAASTSRSSSSGSATRLGLVGYGSSGGSSRSASGSVPDANLSRLPAFTIAGGLSGLYPGRSLPLVLTVTNPFRFAMTVTSITTTVGNASSGCTANNLIVARFVGSLAVPALRSARVSVLATMLTSAPNACQGVTFPLFYLGAAVRS